MDLQEKMNTLFNLGLEMKAVFNKYMHQYELSLDEDTTLPRVTYRIDADGKESITFATKHFSFIDPQTKNFTFPVDLIDSVIEKAQHDLSTAKAIGFPSLEKPNSVSSNKFYAQLVPIIINTPTIHKILWVYVCPIHRMLRYQNWTTQNKKCGCFIVEQEIVNGQCQQGKVFFRPEGYEDEVLTREFKRGDPF